MSNTMLKHPLMVMMKLLTDDLMMEKVQDVTDEGGSLDNKCRDRKTWRASRQLCRVKAK